MRAPDITYGYTAPTDTAGPTFEVVARTIQLSSGALTIDFNELQLPKDRIFVLTNVSMHASPGATQSVALMFVQIRTQTGVLIDIAREDFVLLANQFQNLNWDGEVYVQGGGPPASSLRLFGQFNADANANLLVASYTGIVIPHGNAGAF